MPSAPAFRATENAAVDGAVDVDNISTAVGVLVREGVAVIVTAVSAAASSATVAVPVVAPHAGGAPVIKNCF